MPESIIKRYYDELGQGKLSARKCNKCGAYTFPPTTACEHCGSFDQQWEELSGKGSLLFVSHGIAPPPNPRFDEMAPYAYGHIILEEGVTVEAIVKDVEPTPENLQALFESAPLDVEADPVNVKGLNVLAFKIV
jgi:hypothetical protein